MLLRNASNAIIIYQYIIIYLHANEYLEMISGKSFYAFDATYLTPLAYANYPSHRIESENRLYTERVWIFAAIEASL